MTKGEIVRLSCQLSLNISKQQYAQIIAAGCKKDEQPSTDKTESHAVAIQLPLAKAE